MVSKLVGGMTVGINVYDLTSALFISLLFAILMIGNSKVKYSIQIGS